MTETFTTLVYRFPNNRGALVRRHNGAENFFTVTVLRFTGENDQDFVTDFTTPLTNDVLPWMSPDEVMAALSQIEQYPPIT